MSWSGPWTTPPSCSSSPTPRMTLGSPPRSATSWKRWRAELDRLEEESLYFGEYDEHAAILSVHAGAGGVDAQDWAQMLFRMYQRYLEDAGFSSEVDEVSDGDEAGIKSATMTVRGERAYAMLVGERGVHRLVQDQPIRLERQAAHLLRRRRCHTRGGGRHRRGRPRRPPNRHIPVAGSGRPARQHLGHGSPDNPHPHRCRGRLSGGALAIAEQEPGHGAVTAPDSPNGPARSASTTSTRSEASRVRRPGVVRSARTSSSPTRWSRTCGRTSRWGTSMACSTATCSPSSTPTCIGDAPATKSTRDSPSRPCSRARSADDWFRPPVVGNLARRVEGVTNRLTPRPNRIPRVLIP